MYHNIFSHYFVEWYLCYIHLSLSKLWWSPLCTFMQLILQGKSWQVKLLYNKECIVKELNRYCQKYLQKAAGYITKFSVFWGCLKCCQTESQNCAVSLLSFAFSCSLLKGTAACHCCNSTFLFIFFAYVSILKTLIYIRFNAF